MLTGDGSGALCANHVGPWSARYSANPWVLVTDDAVHDGTDDSVGIQIFIRYGFEGGGACLHVINLSLVVWGQLWVALRDSSQIRSPVGGRFAQAFYNLATGSALGSARLVAASGFGTDVGANLDVQPWGSSMGLFDAL